MEEITFKKITKKLSPEHRKHCNLAGLAHSWKHLRQVNEA